MRSLWRRLCSSGSQASVNAGPKKPWKDSASLIIAAPNGSAKNNFHIFFLKRIANSSFYPNAYVFPGGGVDEADKSSKWIDLFRRLDPLFCENVCKDFFVRQTDGKRSPLFPGDVEKLQSGVLPNEVAFRICAIRESFEESGMLLVTDDVKRREYSNAINAKSMTHLLSKEALHEWRAKVHNNASEFLNLCKELRCVPDIWSLKEWAEWLTPNFPKQKNPKRFDTVFYSCCLKETPLDATHDDIETSDSIWISPVDMLRRHSQKLAYLAPPQVIELAKLMNFQTIESLSTHINQRSSKGLRRTMNYLYFLKDGMRLSVFPGDDLYPDDPDELGERLQFETIDKTYEELLKSQKNIFHFASNSNKFFGAKIVCNFELDYGQVSPVNPEYKKFVNSLPSKL